MAASDTSAQGGQIDATSADQDPAPAGESNESLLAELEAELSAEAPVGKPEAKKPVGGEGDEDDGDGELDDDGDDLDDEEGDEDGDDGDDEEEGDEEEVDATKDPELAKRLAAVRRADQRRLERFTRERAEFTRERDAFAAEVKQVRASVESFEQLRGRARYDPYSVLSALGVPDDDMEYAGQQLYARSKAAAAKPEFRAAADRAMREREANDKLTAAEKRIADVEAKLTSKEQQAAADAELDVYFGRVVRKADDTTPRVKALIAANPKRARSEFEAAAFELGKKLGRLPKPATVRAAVEKKIARELRDFGVDAAATSATAAPAAGRAAAGKKAGAATKPAKAKVAEATGDAETKNGVIYHPTNDELLRELRSGAS